jgi:hypothetical protein
MSDSSIAARGTGVFRGGSAAPICHVNAAASDHIPSAVRVTSSRLSCPLASLMGCGRLRLPRHLPVPDAPVKQFQSRLGRLSPPRRTWRGVFGVRRLDAALCHAQVVTMSDGPHAPPQRRSEQGAYRVTCGTYGKAHFLPTESGVKPPHSKECALHSGSSPLGCDMRPSVARSGAPGRRRCSGVGTRRRRRAPDGAIGPATAPGNTRTARLATLPAQTRHAPPRSSVARPPRGGRRCGRRRAMAGLEGGAPSPSGPDGSAGRAWANGLRPSMQRGAFALVIWGASRSSAPAANAWPPRPGRRPLQTAYQPALPALQRRKVKNQGLTLDGRTWPASVTISLHPTAPSER